MKRKVLAFVLFIGVCGLLVWLFERWLSLDQLIAHESWLRQQVQEHPLRSCLLGFVIYVAASLIPGTGGKSIVYGWIFGLATGLVIVTLALTIAATISFCFSRYVLHGAIHRRLGHYVAHIDRALERDGAYYLFAMRLVHVLFGLLPGTCVFVYTGSHLPTLEKLAERGVLGVISPQLMLAGTLVALSPIVVRFLLPRLGFTRSPSKPS
jgi:uncharacterized membrane protein YdjX (TVP38/TMEM64 family)